LQANLKPLLTMRIPGLALSPAAGSPLSLLLLLAAAAPAAAQSTGRIVGRVIDGEKGTPIAGVVLEVVGTELRGQSAIDGRYTLASVPAGSVAVRARYIGYQPKVVEGIVVPEGGAVSQDIALTTQIVELEEITVAAEAERGTVNRALEEQRFATAVVSAISSEQIAKSPDSDAGQAVQRVSGVTVQDGKYVFVRGLGERYTTTSLNGARIPSPEPEKKIVPLDLFPAGLLETITTSKTFTPDQPGDFSGAQVDLRTREFPARRTATASVGIGLTSGATGVDIVRAPRTGSEWLAFGGGERDMPALVREAGDLTGLTPAEVNQVTAAFRNSWSARRSPGQPNGSLGLSVGGEDPVLGLELGYLGSFTYGISQEMRDEEYRAQAQPQAGGRQTPFNEFAGATGRVTVLWGGMANLSTRLGTGTKITVNNAYNRSADNEATVLQGHSEEFATDLERTRLTFVERSVRSNQLAAEHLFGERHLVDWSVTSSGVTRDEPDRSDLAYTIGNGQPSLWFGAPRSANRTFSALDESSWNLTGNYRLLLGPVANPATIKVGGAWRSTSRDADSRSYDIINSTLSLTERTAPAEDIFDGQYALAGRLILQANANAGRYTADERITAGFGQVEIPFARRFRLIGGVRVERWNLDITTTDPFGVAVPVPAKRKTDVLPALALNIGLAENQTLRLSATQTVSRPEYREIAPIQSFDFGGFLITVGNAELQRARVRNLDARWEWYPRSGELVSVGVFGKFFNDPIERAIQPAAGQNIIKFINADRATNYGVEIELRKRLDFLGSAGSAFTLFSNTTLMHSEIEPGNVTAVSLTESNRPMVGQAPFVINAGLTWLSPEAAWSATVLYNVVGKRVIEAGATPLPDTYELERHVLDFSLQAPFILGATLKLDAKNLLDAPYRQQQGDVMRLRYKAGRSVGLGFRWAL
jgi:outer membrane receptor for ferrienterochelin and colicin